VYTDIRGGSSGSEREPTAMGLSTTTILGDFGGYFFENFRDKAISII